MSCSLPVRLGPQALPGTSQAHTLPRPCVLRPSPVCGFPIRFERAATILDWVSVSFLFGCFPVWAIAMPFWPGRDHVAQLLSLPPSCFLSFFSISLATRFSFFTIYQSLPGSLGPGPSLHSHQIASDPACLSSSTTTYTFLSPSSSFRRPPPGRRCLRASILYSPYPLGWPDAIVPVSFMYMVVDHLVLTRWTGDPSRSIVIFLPISASSLCC